MRDYYWWIPIVGPIIGALIGVFAYKLFIGIHGSEDDIDITTTKVYPRDDRGYKVSLRTSSLTSFRFLILLPLSAFD